MLITLHDASLKGYMHAAVQKVNVGLAVASFIALRIRVNVDKDLKSYIGDLVRANMQKMDWDVVSVYTGNIFLSYAHKEPVAAAQHQH